MDRREFLRTGAAAAVSLAVMDAVAETRSVTSLDLQRHRFGVNYTPSRKWWFCWNDWDAGPIARDLDAIAALGADHLRILLVWPYFQPNPTYVSELHLSRLDQLLTLMGERRLDAVVTVTHCGPLAVTNFTSAPMASRLLRCPTSFNVNQ